MAGNDNQKEELNQTGENIVNYKGDDEIRHYLDYYTEKATDRQPRLYQTGFIELDGLIQGFKTGELNIISGPTGNGKTLFMDSIAHRFMRNEKMKLAYLSYEVPTDTMIQKYVNMDDRESLGLYVPMQLKPGNVNWVIRKCIEAKLKFNCKAIMIDHLHFIVDMNFKQNMSLNIGAVMRHLKHDIANNLNMMVFLIAHQEKVKDEEPSIDNIRDSSFIGQEADNVIVVFRSFDPIPQEVRQKAKKEKLELPKSYEQGYATVKVEKARRAGTYRKKITYQKRGEFLEEC